MRKEHTDQEAERQTSASLAHVLRRWLPVFVILAASVVAWGLGLHEQLTLSALIRNRFALADFVEANLLLSLGGYVLIYAVAVALSFPGASLLTIAGGLLFGWFLGGTATIIAATLGATVIYLAARSSIGVSITRKAGPFISTLSEGFCENAFSYLLFLRLTPIFPFWLVNIAPAIFHVPLATYILATFIGIIPGTYAFAIIGSGLDSVIAAQEMANPGCATAGTCQIDIGALITPELLAAFFALGFASLIPVVVKKMRNRPPSS
ncbi:TVP38/TMEM64 family protein [Roseibium algae]|uniref:TVP38/TMEM64 family membrane protein n=1 Tax=Roseibium algae TaxID=3123038 RepID=A0ABU8TPV1_9HYPH